MLGIIYIYRETTWFDTAYLKRKQYCWCLMIRNWFHWLFRQISFRVTIHAAFPSFVDFVRYTCKLFKLFWQVTDVDAVYISKLWWMLSQAFLGNTYTFNALDPGRFQIEFRLAIFRLILVKDGWGIPYEIALRWMPLDLTDDESTLVQVMAWCRQAANHYLSQCWPRSMSPNIVTRPQWVNKTLVKTTSVILNAWWWISY